MPSLPTVNSRFWPPSSTSTRSNTTSRSSASPGACWKYHGELAGVGVERQRRARVERLVERRHAAAARHPGFRLRGAPVGEIQSGIVAAGDPRLAAGAEQMSGSAPQVSPPGSPCRWRPCRTARARLPRGRVVGADEAFLLAVIACSRRGPGSPCLWPRAGRCWCREAALVRSPMVGLPHGLAGPRIERHQLRVAGRREDLVVVDRDAAHRAAVRRSVPTRFSQINSPVLPSIACMMLPGLSR